MAQSRRSFQVASEYMAKTVRERLIFEHFGHFYHMNVTNVKTSRGK